MADKVMYLPGKEITAEDVKDADALIVRTRTKCNEALLKGSKVKFIGTATIGFDHIDADYCQKNHIAWSNCPGCNAGSVEQYLHSVLLLLQKEKGIVLKEQTLGIIGVGHVGSRIECLAKDMGMKIVLNDPPRADQGEKGFEDLRSIAEKCDIITFHTPLIHNGKYKTYHLANKEFFDALKKKPIIINTSRGEVIDTTAIMNALDKRQISDAVIDVWEHEPDINLNLLNRIFLGTPHIAGYSADGKANATNMVLKALCKHFNIKAEFNIIPPEDPIKEYSEDEEIKALQKYNPHRDCELLRKDPTTFEYLRGNYPLRRE